MPLEITFASKVITLYARIFSNYNQKPGNFNISKLDKILISKMFHLDKIGSRM